MLDSHVYMVPGAEGNLPDKIPLRGFGIAAVYWELSAWDCFDIILQFQSIHQVVDTYLYYVEQCETNGFKEPMDQGK